MGLHPQERRNAMLPCGRTLGKSWAGLRKAWLGFKIANANGDLAKKKYYASFIVKVRGQMGIAVRHFEEGILDEQSNGNINLKTDLVEDTESIDIDQKIQEGQPDYDEIMGQIPVYAPVPVPREDIFNKSKPESDKSFEPPGGQDRVRLTKRITNYGCFCPTGPPEQAIPNPTNVTSYTLNTESFCEFIASGESEIEKTQEHGIDSKGAVYPQYENDNTPEDEIENEEDDCPVSPAIARSDEMYATYYDRSERSCPVVDRSSDIGAPTDRISDNVPKEELDAIEKERKRRSNYKFQLYIINTNKIVTGKSLIISI